MTNAKKKGNKWENKLANWLYDHGFKAWKDGQSGGGSREKGDVGNNLDMTIESKAAKRLEVPKWWKQVAYSASQHGNQPVLFMHPDGMPDNEWLVVMHSEDWMYHMKRSHREVEVVYEAKEDSRDLKWKVENLVRAGKELLKQLKKEDE